jgi:hypothetical protein
MTDDGALSVVGHPPFSFLVVYCVHVVSFVNNVEEFASSDANGASEDAPLLQKGHLHSFVGGGAAAWTLLEIYPEKGRHSRLRGYGT